MSRGEGLGLNIAGGGGVKIAPLQHEAGANGETHLRVVGGVGGRVEGGGGGGFLRGCGAGHATHRGRGPGGAHNEEHLRGG